MGCSHKGSIVKDHKNKKINILLVVLSLILCIVVVYIKAQKFDFVGYDDELYVTENLHVQKGVSLEGVKWAFTTFHAANWHPVYFFQRPFNSIQVFLKHAPTLILFKILHYQDER